MNSKEFVMNYTEGELDKAKQEFSATASSKWLCGIYEFD
jgi:hypothetical protein